MSKALCANIKIGSPFMLDGTPALDVKVVTVDENEVLCEGALKPPTYNWGQFKIRSYSSCGYGLSPCIGHVQNTIKAVDKKYATALLKGLAVLAIQDFIPEGFVNSRGEFLKRIYVSRNSFNYYSDDYDDDDDETETVTVEVSNWDKFIDMCYEFIINDYQIES